MDALGRVIQRLERPRIRPNGQYEACCPAHADQNPSLSISQGDDGRVLLNCFAGCSPERIVDALGLTMRDLHESPMEKFACDSGPRKISDVYSYCGLDGQILAEVVRYSPKGFSQRRYDCAGEVVWDIQGVPDTPYKWPELHANPSTSVYIVEGEKDVHALIERGLVATTARGGAHGGGSRWSSPTMTEPLRGRDVILIPDNDAAGRDYTKSAGKALLGIAKSVRVLELGLAAKGADVSDFFSAGRSAEELATLARTRAEAFETWAESQTAKSCGGDVRAERQSPLTVVRACDLGEPKPREFLCEGLVPRGYTTVLCGPGGSGKSYLALGLAYLALAGRDFLGRRSSCDRAFYIDAEGLGEGEISRRLHSIRQGCGDDVLPAEMYIVPLAGSSLEASISELLRRYPMTEHDLVVIDSMIAAAFEVDANDARDVVGWLKRVVGRFAPATILLLDHTSKPSKLSPKATSPFGSVFKFNLARSVLMLSHAGENALILEQTKANFTTRAEPIGIQLLIDNTGVFFNPTAAIPRARTPRRATREIVHALADGPRGLADISDATGFPKDAVSRELSKLKQEGKVINLERGQWACASYLVEATTETG